MLKLQHLPGFVLLNPRFGEFKLAAIYKSSSSLDHIIIILSLKHAITGVESPQDVIPSASVTKLKTCVKRVFSCEWK